MGRFVEAPVTRKMTIVTFVSSEFRVKFSLQSVNSFLFNSLKMARWTTMSSSCLRSQLHRYSEVLPTNIKMSGWCDVLSDEKTCNNNAVIISVCFVHITCPSETLRRFLQTFPQPHPVSPQVCPDLSSLCSLEPGV